MRRSRCARVELRWAGLSRVGCFLVAMALVPGNALSAPAAQRRVSPEATAAAVLDEVATQLWQRSDRFFHRGDYETTTRVNRLVVRLDPHFVEGINTLAWLLRQGLGRPREALLLHYRAVRDNPDQWDAYFDLGMFYFDTKQYALAARCFELAAAHGAPCVPQHMLPHAYEKMGRLREAQEAWKGILQRFPTDLVARRNLERLEKGLDKETD